MKKVLFIGEHPISTSGNAGMMLSILGSVDTSKYEVNVFALESSPPDPSLLVSRPMPFSIIHAVMPGDTFGNNKLLTIVSKADLDAIVMVGIDIWTFAPIMKDLKQIVDNRGIGWAAIFPYDLQEIRKDWVDWIKGFTHPCVYSKWGESLLKNEVPNIQYFRPPLHISNVWEKFDEKERRLARSKTFPTVPKESIIFGFIGANQIRKDPQKLIKAFAMAKKQVDVDIRLYLHTSLKTMFDLQQYAIDCGLFTNDVLTIRPGEYFSLPGMVRIYNSLDCLINCSLQEGLSWTLLEAMLCGTPFIATKTTAQIELLEGAGYGIDCEELAYIPLVGAYGNTWIEGKSCKVEDLADAMCKIATNHYLREVLSENGLQKGKEWLEGVSDINELLTEATGYIEPIVMENKKEAVLFAQHSAAGDVLMTTRCFKGIKERYNLPLHYMTDNQYTDIVTNNPYIDEIIPWSNKVFEQYHVIINPHGDRIGPGHWGRNSNSLLSDFYWKILEVEPDDFFIELKQPNGTFDTLSPIAILHTTGGDSQFRTYKFMKDIHEGLKDRYTTVQLGGANDYPAWADIDLRGKLSFRETAWVMSKASIAVTVDSFISHLAGALGVSQVCLFGSGNSNVVQPNQIRGGLICLTPDYIKHCVGLGPCSASIRDCPVPCTGRHSPEDILSAIEKIEEEVLYAEAIGGGKQYVQ